MVYFLSLDLDHSVDVVLVGVVVDEFHLRWLDRVDIFVVRVNKIILFNLVGN